MLLWGTLHHQTWLLSSLLCLFLLKREELLKSAHLYSCCYFPLCIGLAFHYFFYGITIVFLHREPKRDTKMGRPH